MLGGRARTWRVGDGDDCAADRQLYGRGHSGGDAGDGPFAGRTWPSPSSALAGALALAFSERRDVTRRLNGSGITPTRLLVAAVRVAVIFAAQFALYRIMQRFAVDPLGGCARSLYGDHALRPPRRCFPFGSGMGTFAPVYATFEKPDDALRNAYVNHAHNDIAEVVARGRRRRGGSRGPFRPLVWHARIQGLATHRSPEGQEIDRLLARAATLAIGLICLPIPWSTIRCAPKRSWSCSRFRAPFSSPRRRRTACEIATRPQARAPPSATRVLRAPSPAAYVPPAPTPAPNSRRALGRGRRVARGMASVERGACAAQTRRLERARDPE